MQKTPKKTTEKPSGLVNLNFSNLIGYEFMVRAQLLNFRSLLGRNSKLRHQLSFLLALYTECSVHIGGQDSE